jgi:hypothetical protein
MSSELFKPAAGKPNSTGRYFSDEDNMEQKNIP